MLEQILFQVFRSLVAVAQSKGAEGIGEIFGALSREGASNDELAGLDAELVAERLRRVAEHSPDGTISNAAIINALNEERHAADERMRADQAKSQTKQAEHSKPIDTAGAAGSTANAGNMAGNAAAGHAGDPPTQGS